MREGPREEGRKSEATDRQSEGERSREIDRQAKRRRERREGEDVNTD